MSELLECHDNCQDRCHSSKSIGQPILFSNALTGTHQARGREPCRKLQVFKGFMRLGEIEGNCLKALAREP